MNKISDHITHFQSPFWQLNSTICHHRDTTIVWDPGYTETEIKFLLEQANQHKASGRYLIYTHGDFDHIVGDPLFKDFKKVGSSLIASRKDPSGILDQIREVDHEFYLDRTYDLEFPVLDIPVNPQRELTVQLGNLEIFFYKAGGHTVDGIFTVVPSLHLLVAGDYLSDIEFPFIGDNIEEYYKTLEVAGSIMREFNISWMIPGHGQPTISQKQVYERIDQSHRYLDSLVLNENIPHWSKSWGLSPYDRYLDKAHQKNINYVRSQRI